MIARKRLHMIVIALCLWLPLQAVAGQWQHCAKMESSLSATNKNLSVKDTNVVSTTEQQSCHEVAQDTAPVQDQSSADMKSTCNHCQFVCHWHFVIVLRELMPASINMAIAYTHFTIPSPQQPTLATPQRPPQFAA